MPLTLTLHTPTSIPLEVDGVSVQSVRQQSTDDVLRTLVQRGNRQVPLGDFFAASGSAAEDETLVWQGDCSRVKSIGSGLSGGCVRVAGDAGPHLGSRMSGGAVICEGNAGDWAGAEMSGGRLVIQGNAGNLVGAVYRGGRKGMTGGEIVVHGDAGDEAGHTMRRGLIVVCGRLGDAGGTGMIAGSLVVFGESGRYPGAGMKRGTILLGHAPRDGALLPSFRFAATYQPVFVRMLLRYVQQCLVSVPVEVDDSSWRRYCGDLLSLGQGELLVREAR